MFDEVLNVAMRWLHVMGAITLLGAAIVGLVVNTAVFAKLPEEGRREYRAIAMPKFAMLVGIGTLALLVSGIYNYVVVMRALHVGQSQYDMMMGIKILIAIVVFFLAAALTGKSAAFQKIRDNRKLWLTITVLLGAAIVAIASYLRMMPVSTGA